MGAVHRLDIIRDTDTEEDTAMKRKTIIMLLAIVILTI